MSSITFKVANAQSFVGEETAFLLGKNGYSTSLGVVKPLVTSVSIADSNLIFSMSNLHLLHDDNFNCHLLESRSNTLYVSNTSQVDNNIIRYSLDSKTLSTEAGLMEGLVGFDSTITKVSSEISDFNISSNTITVTYDSSAMSSFINSKLLSVPFYVDLFQLIDSRFNSSNTYYVAGDIREVSNTHNVTSFNTTANLVINTSPPTEGLIKTFKNGSETKTSATQYSFIPGTDFITHSIASSDIQIETVVSDYTTPHIEEGDSILLLDNEEIKVVNNSSYDTLSSTFNAALTSSDFFKVTLDSNIASNVGTTDIINVSADLFAKIDNVNLSSNTVKVIYDESTAGAVYNLANNKIYEIVPLSLNAFSPVTLDGTVLKDIGAGAHIIKASSVNERNRISLPITKSVKIIPPPLGQVTNLQLSEVLFRDRTKGIMSRVKVTFDHISNRNVTDYELSYRIVRIAGSEEHPSGMDDFNTIKLDSSGRDSTNKMRYTIDNLDLGKAGNTYSLEVRVLPKNGFVGGLESVSSILLSGKSSNPLNVTEFSVSQSDTTLIFEVDYPVDSQNHLDELDILHTEIRYKSPLQSVDSQASIDSSFTTGDLLLLIPHPLTRQEIAVDKVGEGSFTFTAKTVDTSGNKAASAVGANFSVTLSSSSETIAAYNEADPTSNVISNQLNDNYSANYFVSVNESDNGGFVYDVDPITTSIVGSDTPSTLAEDANASASGFSWSPVSGEVNETDLIINDSNSRYISPIRDLGTVVKGSLVINSSINTFLNEHFSDISTKLIEGVAETPPSSNVLFDSDFEIGTVAGFSNTTHSFTFSSQHSTLVADSSDTLIYAVVNPGQSVVGQIEGKDDISNVHSYAFITGAINAHAVELSNVYYANGHAVPGGNLSSDVALSNLTQSGTQYVLADLSQFTDAFGQLNFAPNLPVSKNVFARFSSSNVFLEADAGSSKPHGNVSTSLFDSTSLDGNWTKQFTGLRDFRYFQVRMDIDIDKYGSDSNAFLNEFSYQVLSRRKNFSTTITSNDMIIYDIPVDYSSLNYYNIPDVFTQVLSDGSYIAKTQDLTNIGCNVRIYDTQNGNLVTAGDINILVSAVGA